MNEWPTLVRDGTVWGPNGTEIDLRTPKGDVWVTVKGDDTNSVEFIAAMLAAFDGTTIIQERDV
jgi:hypothetical protein